MVFFRCAASLSVAVILSLLSTSAEAGLGTTTTYGTASGESGPDYTGGTIGVSSTVRLNDGATVSGTGIEGASPQKLAKGDYIMVPPDTPHQLQDVQGEFVIMSVHMIIPEKK